MTEWVGVCLLFWFVPPPSLPWRMMMINRRVMGGTKSLKLLKINKNLFVRPHQFTAIGTVKTIGETVTFLCDLHFFVVVWHNLWKDIRLWQKIMFVYLQVSAKPAVQSISLCLIEPFVPANRGGQHYGYKSSCRQTAFSKLVNQDWNFYLSLMCSFSWNPHSCMMCQAAFKVCLSYWEVS